jgi:hypothetical protein
MKLGTKPDTFHIFALSVCIYWCVDLFWFHVRVSCSCGFLVLITMPAEQYFVVDPGKTFTVCDVANFGSTIPGIINVAHILISLLSWTFYSKNVVVRMELQMLFHITRVCRRFTSGWLSMYFPTHLWGGSRLPCNDQLR